MPEAGPGRPVLSVIIPAMNEAENLQSLLPALQQTLAGLGVPTEVIVADRGSTDATSAVAGEVGARVIRQVEPLRRGPARRWILPGAYAKEHITRYDPAGLRRLLTAMGCEVLEARYVGFSEWIAKCRKVGPCAPHLAVATWG